MNNCDKATQQLVELSKKQGYITEDSIIKICEKFNLSLTKFDTVYSSLQSAGIIINDSDMLENITSEEFDSDKIYESHKTRINYDEIFDRVLLIAPSLEDYIEQIKHIKAPQKGEERELIYQAKLGNKYATDRLVKMFQKSLLKLSLHYYDKYELDIEDTLQYANIGLLIAIDKMPKSDEYRFSTYYPWWSRQVISRESHIPHSLLRFPVHYKDKLILVKEIINGKEDSMFENEKSFNSIIDEICLKLDCDCEYAKVAVESLSYFSIYDTLLTEKLSDCNNCIEEVNECVDCFLLKKAISEVLESLTEKEKDVIMHRFGFINNRIYTLEEVGEKYNVTRERIRQIEAKAIRKLSHSTRKKRLHKFS